LPSMLMAMPLLWSKLMNSALVNWLPWSRPEVVCQAIVVAAAIDLKRGEPRRFSALM
jgi:hypothetical protein